MSKKFTDSKKTGEGQYADKQSRSQESTDTLADSNERRQLAIRSLLETLPVDADDKLTMLKAAHHVDKDRFQSSFKSFMKNAKP